MQYAMSNRCAVLPDRIGYLMTADDTGFEVPRLPQAFGKGRSCGSRDAMTKKVFHEEGCELGTTRDTGL